MKKNLLLVLLGCYIFISCDERKTTDIVPAVVPTVLKTDLISRKWSIAENYMDVDSKKTVLYGVGAVNNPNLSNDFTPNDYFLFMKDGKMETYSDSDKTTAKGTWKLINVETQLQFSIDGQDFTMDIITLTDKDVDIAQKIVIANLANETQTGKNIVLLAGIGQLADKTSKIVKFGFKLKAK